MKDGRHHVRTSQAEGPASPLPPFEGSAGRRLSAPLPLPVIPSAPVTFSCLNGLEARMGRRHSAREKKNLKGLAHPLPPQTQVASQGCPTVQPCRPWEDTAEVHHPCLPPSFPGDGKLPTQLRSQAGPGVWDRYQSCLVWREAELSRGPPQDKHFRVPWKDCYQLATCSDSWGGGGAPCPFRQPHSSLKPQAT